MHSVFRILIDCHSFLYYYYYYLAVQKRIINTLSRFSLLYLFTLFDLFVVVQYQNTVKTLLYVNLRIVRVNG
jgi:hypothetical protein